MLSRPADRPSLLSGPFVRALVATVGLYLGHQLVLPVFPLFVEQVLDDSMAGLLSGAFMVSTGTGTLAIPFLMRRWGRKAALLLGVALLTAVAAYPLLAAPLPLLLVTVVRGFGFGVANVALFTVVVDGLPLERRGEGLGVYQFAVSIGGMLGASAGVAVWQRLGFGWVIAASLAVVTVTAVSAGSVRGMLGRLGRGGAPSVFRALGRLPQLRRPTAVFAMLTFSYGGIVTFGALYVIEGGVASPALFFFLLMGSQVLARPLAGWICDRRDVQEVLTASIAVAVGGLVLLAVGGHALAVAAGATAFGLGFGAGVIGSQMALMARLDASERPLASAMFGVAYSGGMGVGAGVLALAVRWTGYQGLFWVMATVASCGLLLSAARLWRARRVAGA